MSEMTGYCFSHQRRLFDDEPETHREDGCHVGYRHLYSHPRAPPPTPPRWPHPDHAPEPPDIRVEEFNVKIPCPRCGHPTFGRRYADGSLWSGEHSVPGVVGTCKPQLIETQETLEVFA